MGKRDLKKKITIVDLLYYVLIFVLTCFTFISYDWILYEERRCDFVFLSTVIILSVIFICFIWNILPDTKEEDKIPFK